LDVCCYTCSTLVDVSFVTPMLLDVCRWEGLSKSGVQNLICLKMPENEDIVDAHRMMCVACLKNEKGQVITVEQAPQECINPYINTFILLCWSTMKGCKGISTHHEHFSPFSEFHSILLWYHYESQRNGPF